jgi:hypothetical protein
MKIKTHLSTARWFATAACALLIPGFVFAGGASDNLQQTFGPNYDAAANLDASPRNGPRNDIDTVRRWNRIAIDASGLDHAGAREQLGPGRASRALAIVHIAMFDTIVAVVGEYQSYTGVRAPSGPLSMKAAISQAAHDTLAACSRHKP